MTAAPTVFPTTTAPVFMQKTAATPPVQFIDRVVNVPVTAHRQTPVIQKVQKTVEVPQIQFIDKFADASASVQTEGKKRKLRLPTEGKTLFVNTASGDAEEDEGETHAPVHFSLCDGDELRRDPRDDKWQVDDIVDKGFGFGKIPTGETVFIHASVVHGGEVLMVGTDAWVQVVNDEVRAEGGYRARNAWGRNAWKEEKDSEKANSVAQRVRRAAALTAELAAQSEKKVAVVCNHPPGLRDEPAEHITAPTRRDFATSLPSTLRRLTCDTPRPK